jgi:mannose-6-phosphate isomerase-like protein (cupin superfamily)
VRPPGLRLNRRLKPHEDLDRTFEQGDRAGRTTRMARATAGERIGSRRKLLRQAANAQKLGCCQFEVAPGRRTRAVHHHLANEGAIYVLGVTGTLRLGDEEFVVNQGDFIPLRSALKNRRPRSLRRSTISFNAASASALGWSDVSVICEPQLEPIRVAPQSQPDLLA